MRSDQPRRFSPGFENPDRSHSRTRLPLVWSLNAAIHTVTLAMNGINYRYHRVIACLGLECNSERFPAFGAKSET